MGTYHQILICTQTHLHFQPQVVRCHWPWKHELNRAISPQVSIGTLLIFGVSLDALISALLLCKNLHPPYKKNEWVKLLNYELTEQRGKKKENVKCHYNLFLILF